jgi:hypothetical protein
LIEPRVSRGAAFGDLDNDGDIDVVVGELDGAPMFLQNDADKTNRWIKLELAAIKGTPLAIGTRVKITAGGVSQVEEIRSGGSYLSQNDLRLHFGLGKSENVDLVEIRWPSGKTEVIRDLAGNKVYAIKESSGVVAIESIRPKRK